jgi:uncharacterized membrane protein YdjX (TVP38/TMEM64 family)
MLRRNLPAILFVAVILAVLAAVFFSPLGDWLTVEQLKESRGRLAAIVAERPIFYIGGFFAASTAAFALCWPAKPIIGISAGALFGFWTGLAATWTAVAIGSTLAFLASRYLLRNWVERRFSASIAAIDRGIERNGGVYLLSIRINPVIPYWLVNLAMGVTNMRLGTYVPLTIIGIFPATFLYVQAGAKLATIESASDILSPQIMGALLLLSLAPLFVGWVKRRREAKSQASGAPPLC